MSSPLSGDQSPPPLLTITAPTAEPPVSGDYSPPPPPPAEPPVSGDYSPPPPPAEPPVSGDYPPPPPPAEPPVSGDYPPPPLPAGTPGFRGYTPPPVSARGSKPAESSDGGTNVTVAIVVPVVTVLVVLAMVGIYCWWARVARKRKEQILLAAVAPPINPVQVDVREENAPTVESFLEANKKPSRFTAQQLGAFTSNYSTRLGSGGFGEVYKGNLPDGSNIAVKVLTGKHDRKQFMAEVGTLGMTYHINLVRLYGYCYDYDPYMCALVFEYMENGSLDKYLFDETQVIGWGKLCEIAVGTARGLAYLHEDCPKRIVHYDIKPGNILLDGDFSAKVADFGLAMLLNRDDTHASLSGYRGTPSYSAPELTYPDFPITHKCDVYSFGMVLFEIAGRRRNKISGSPDSMNWFPKQVWAEYEKGQLVNIIEALPIEEKGRERAERMLMVALWCVQHLPEHRPPMSAVVKMLDGGVAIMPPPQPFRYLFSVGVNATGGGDQCTSSGCASDNSQWYKEATQMIAKE